MNTGDSFEVLIRELVEGHEAAGRWRIDIADDGPFIALDPGAGAVADQGWKLHVSATPWSADDVLRRAAPVLLVEDAPFKVAASHRSLDAMNHGEGGLSQIGKFITVYPRDDEQAVRLAGALDDATAGLDGPRIPSDRPLRPGSLVHYRYGSFAGRLVHMPTGEVVSMLAGPSGELEREKRGVEYDAPAWAVDPFAAAGIFEPEGPGTIGGRYVPVVMLHRSPRGTVQLAADLDAGRSCVLKRAARGTRAGPRGRDARDDLRREADVIAHLGPDPLVPEVVEVLGHDGDLYLVLEHVEGITLSRYLAEQGRTGRLLPEDKVVQWGRSLAQGLGRFHAKGYAYRDLTSMNVLVGPDGKLGLVDFELARELGTRDELFGAGTQGYWSPEQARGKAAAVGDDVFSLGAVLYLLVTGAEPGIAPDTENLLSRPVEPLRPRVRRAMVDVIERSLRTDPGERFLSMQEVDEALAAVGRSGVSLARPSDHTDRAPTYLELARDIGDRLITALQRGSTQQPMEVPHLAGGAAGSLLALCEVADEAGDDRYMAAVIEAATEVTATPSSNLPSPGLYTGEAGIGLAILRAGQLIRDPALVETAARRGRTVASLPFDSPDVISGTAGRVLFHLLLWDETSSEEHLHDARAAATALIDSAQDAGGGAVKWPIPEGWDELSGATHLGYAHGAAGIADALLDVFDATGDEHLLETAARAARWLERQAIPALDDGRGRTWPHEEGGPAAGALWCHGSTGIGKFFLHASRAGIPGAADMAIGAARMVADGARFLGPLTCHGLSGNIEFLLDMWRATQDKTWLDRVHTLAQLLIAYRLKKEDAWQWVGGMTGTLGPDYLNGYAGIAPCLLRLADPSRPSLISREGFRFSRRRQLSSSPR